MVLAQFFLSPIHLLSSLLSCLYDVQLTVKVGEIFDKEDDSIPPSLIYKGVYGRSL